jgi:hypothetical protein
MVVLSVTNAMKFNQFMITMLVALLPGRAADQTASISVTIDAKAQTYRALGDAVLEIHISNPSEQPVSVRTMEADPPVRPAAVDEHGRSALINRPAPKDGTTNNRDYRLEAKETKTYNVTVRDLLGRGQKLPSLEAGAVECERFVADDQVSGWRLQS